MMKYRIVEYVYELVSDNSYKYSLIVNTLHVVIVLLPSKIISVGMREYNI